MTFKFKKAEKDSANESLLAKKRSNTENVKTPKASEAEAFEKFRDCTICLESFKNGDKVKVMPMCSHIFHDNCCSSWLDFKFTCPNCNLPIEFKARRPPRASSQPQQPIQIGDEPPQFPDRFSPQESSSSSDLTIDLRRRYEQMSDVFEEVKEDQIGGLPRLMGSGFYIENNHQLTVSSEDNDNDGISPGLRRMRSYSSSRS